MLRVSERCVVRYGYKDTIEDTMEFERLLVDNLLEFLQHEHFILEESPVEHVNTGDNVPHFGIQTDGRARRSSASAVHIEESFGSIKLTSSSNRITPVPVESCGEEEIAFMKKAKDDGVFYLIGEAEVVAQKDSSLLKKFTINYAYSFLRKNFRQGQKVLAIPRTRLLKVGMTYEV